MNRSSTLYISPGFRLGGTKQHGERIGATRITVSAAKKSATSDMIQSNWTIGEGLNRRRKHVRILGNVVSRL